MDRITGFSTSLPIDDRQAVGAVQIGLETIRARSTSAALGEKTGLTTATLAGWITPCR